MLGEGLTNEAGRTHGLHHKVNEINGASALKKEKGCQRRKDHSLNREDHVIIISTYRKVFFWWKYPSYCWKSKRAYEQI